MENTNAFSYDKSVKRIEEIVAQLEQDNKGIDELVALIHEASDLVKACKQKLKATETEIGKAFEEE